MHVRRAVYGGIALFATAFAIEGGEYGTSDVIRQRTRLRALDGDVSRLRREVDSLRGAFASVATDTVRLERLAREDFGMVRGDKEILYLTRTQRANRDGAPDSSATTGPRG